METRWAGVPVQVRILHSPVPFFGREESGEMVDAPG
jgi:hypothetical protein